MNLEDFFGPPIHTYTREDALADGVLVDARIGDFEEVTHQHHPNAVPVVMTAALYQLIARAAANPRAHNDLRGVWHDVLTVARVTLRGRSLPLGTRHEFQVVITGVGRRRYHQLAVTWDGEGLTFLLGNED